MTGLLDLPSELLFQIIHVVLSAPHPILPNGQRRPEGRFTGRNTFCFPTPDILWAPEALNLLLANRRLYSETILYLSKKPQDFKIDVAIVNTHWIWPTLRTMPVRNNGDVLDKVEIEFMLCCTKDERHVGRTGWVLCIRELLKLLRHFLELQNPPVTRINTLKININTTRHGNGNEKFSEEDIPFRKIHGAAHLAFDALYPIDEQSALAFYLQLSPDIALAFPAGDFYPHRLGKVSFCVDGKVRKEVDIANMRASQSSDF